MDIEGPLTIKVVNDPATAGYQLLLNFTAEFRNLALPAQGATMREYQRHLYEEIDKRREDDRDRAGMLVIQQIVENLLPHVEAGELELEQTITIQVGEDSPLVSLAKLLS